MRAVILAVGSELLGTDRLDTNSLRLTEVLRAHGVNLFRKAALPDQEEVVAREVERALADADLVLITGGLGPTADDITREAVARALGLQLILDEAVLASVERRFSRMGMAMPATNRKQAEVLQGAFLLRNARGTAPGQRLSAGVGTLFLFPGVPAELEGMIAGELVPWLAERADAGSAVETLTLRVSCLPESELERRILPVYEEFGRDDISVLAALGDVRVRVSATGPAAQRRERLSAAAARLRELIGDPLYSEGGAEAEADSLEGVVGRALHRRAETVGVAESCTGGLICERLTRIAGSSDWVLGGVVAYSNDVKCGLLGVDEAAIKEHGAVSEAVARALAEGACRVLGSHWGVGVTGIAGPGGGSAEKPVGTVHLALASHGATVGALRIRLPGDRDRVRQGASQVALEMLRRALLGLPALRQL